MTLKPQISLKLGQQLKMTPQLQQAIRLLQLSNIELQQEIQEALDSNLMLEEENPDDAAEERENEEIDSLSADSEFDTPDQNEDGEESDQIQQDPEVDGDLVLDSSEELSSDTLTEDLPIDSAWEDVFDETASFQNQAGDDDQDYLNSLNAPEITLQDHMTEQVSLLNLSDSDRLIAMAIIDALDEDGYIQGSLEDILSSMPEELEVEIDEVLAVLHLIQRLDPVGVAARDLRECLLVQLSTLSEATPWKQEACNLVDQYIEALGSRDFNLLKRKLHLDENDLKSTIDLILSLNPRPGSGITSSRVEYIEPDVLVTKEKSRWMVMLNPVTTPKIRVNHEYARLIKRADSSSDNVKLKDQLQEARWFLKSLQQRNDTLLRVATKIVEYQKGFLEYGEEAMKPLVLHDIADALGLHESTISRVTTQKYMHTPSGIFELKYFFSSHVSTHAGGEISSTAIRALIKKLVSEEDPRKPLSDNKIVNLLASQDIKVARRTIAKYREALMIPPSNERKQLV